MSGGFTRSFNRERIDRFIDLVGGNPGGRFPRRAARPRATSRWCCRASHGRCCCARRAASGPPAFATTPTLPAHGELVDERQRVRSEAQDAVHGFVVGRPAALARPRHGGRSPLHRQPEQERLVDARTGTWRTSRRTGSSTSSSWRSRTSTPTSPRAAAPRSPTSGRARARRRSRSSSAPSPGWRRPTRPNPRQLHDRGERQRGAVHQRDLGEPPRPVQAGSVRHRDQPLTGNNGLWQGEHAGGRVCRSNFYQYESGRQTTATSAQHPDVGRRRTLQLAAGRPAPPVVEGPAGHRQLHLRPSVASCAADEHDWQHRQQQRQRRHDRRPQRCERLPLRPDEPARRQRAARPQAAVGVRPAVRPRPAVRRRHEQVARRPRRRLAVSGSSRVQVQAFRHVQREDRRHELRRRPGRCSRSSGSGRPDDRSDSGLEHAG